MRSPLLVAVAATLALTACGSTVQQSGQQALTQGLDGSASSTTTGGAAADGTTGTTGATGSTSGTTGVTNDPSTQTGTSTSGGSSPSGTSSTTGSAPATVQPGPASTAVATGGAVDLGVIIFPDVNAAAKQFGGTADVGDQKAEAKAAIDWVNAHGGLGGHRANPVYFEVSLTSTQTYAVTYQQICSTFTQDHHVVATILIGNAEPGLPSCLNKAKSMLLAHGHYMHTEADYRQLSNLITPDDVSSDRVARAMSREILNRGLVRSGDTLGLLVMDYAAPQQARDKIIVPAMKAKGVKVISYTIAYPQSTQDIAGSASSVQSAELAMASAGVKNVAFLCPGCVSFFMQDAETQAYYPRYIVSSLDTVGGVKGKGHGKSLANVFALGWDPTRDVGTYSNPGLLGNNATYTLCRSIEKANITADASLFASVAFCGALLNLQAAASANPVTKLTGPSIMAGFNKLGTSHSGAANFSTRLDADHHDGTASYRTMHYTASCDCLQYDNATSYPFS